MKPSKEVVLEALKAFHLVYSNVTEDGEFKRGRRYNPEEIVRVQQAFNRYLKLNKDYHGRYTPSNSSEFLK